MITPEYSIRAERDGYTVVAPLRSRKGPYIVRDPYGADLCACPDLDHALALIGDLT